jgi:uncharacterized repeat protein (TIGR02543 family)
MTRKLLLGAFLLTIALTVIATGHQLTNAAANMAPPPQHAPAIGATPTPVWKVIEGGGGQDVYLSDISLSSSTDGWAVGTTGPSSYGVLMHYDGSTWNRTTVPTGTYGINAVKMISPTEGWAVGATACSTDCDALFLHYVNGAWQKVTISPPGNQTGYSDVDIKGNTGWAIGYGWAQRFDGTSWTGTSIYNPMAPGDYYNDVSVVGENEAWLVGKSRQAMYYNGIDWLPSSLGLNSLPMTLTVRMQAIHMLDATEGWAAGYASATYCDPIGCEEVTQCLLVHRSNGPWTQVQCPIENLRLSAIQMRSTTDVWATGRTYPNRNPTALHYDGVNWTVVSLPVSASSIALADTNDGWMSGALGTMLRLISGVWTRIQGSSFSIGAASAPVYLSKPIDAASVNNVWWFGGSSGELYEWNNGSVITHTPPVTQELYVLDMVSPTLGWAGTASGWMYNTPDYLLRYSAGTWTTWPMTSGVYALSMLTPEEGWIASGDSSSPIFHYLNGNLIPETLLDTVYSLSMLDSQHGWAIGFNQGVFSYTMGSWALVTPTLRIESSNVRIIGISPSEAWVAGYSMSCNEVSCPAQPELHHFSGGIWTNVVSTTSQLSSEWLAFFDISKVSATEWWAAGKLKTLEHAFLHYKDGSYTTVSAAGEDVMAVSMLPDGLGFASSVGSLLQFHSPVDNVITYTLTVNTVGNGTVSRQPNQPSYPDGTTVVLTATANAGYVFSGWSGTLSGTTNPITITMSANASVTATFVVGQLPLANAGHPQTVKSMSPVILDGSSSYDPDNSLPLNYGWQQVGGEPVLLSNVVISRPTFIAPGVTLTQGLTFSLVVTDSMGLISEPSQVSITVEPYRCLLPLVIK